MTTKTRFGHTRSGRSPLPGAVVIGVALTAVVDGIAALANHGAAAWQLPLVLTAACLPILIVLGWALLVDRRTVDGFTPRPEESVEGRWYDTATQGSFHDLLTVLGLATAALAIIPAARAVPAYTALLVVLVFAGLDVAVRYQLAKRRDA